MRIYACGSFSEVCIWNAIDKISGLTSSWGKEMGLCNKANHKIFWNLSLLRYLFNSKWKLNLNIYFLNNKVKPFITWRLNNAMFFHQLNWSLAQTAHERWISGLGFKAKFQDKKLTLGKYVVFYISGDDFDKLFYQDATECKLQWTSSIYRTNFNDRFVDFTVLPA